MKLGIDTKKLENDTKTKNPFPHLPEKIKKRGKVHFGDKSILDIYIPVYDDIVANDIIHIN